MKKNLSYIVGFGLVLISGSIFTNPGLSEYESYEMKRFKGLEETTGYKSHKCSENGYKARSFRSVSFNDYQAICTEIVSKFDNNPEKLLATIRGNTKRSNFLLFSTYTTHYPEVSNLVDDAVKQHPTYSPLPSDITDTGTGGAVVGVFGSFLDFRFGTW